MTCALCRIRQPHPSSEICVDCAASGTVPSCRTEELDPELTARIAGIARLRALAEMA